MPGLSIFAWNAYHTQGIFSSQEARVKESKASWIVNMNEVSQSMELVLLQVNLRVMTGGAQRRRLAQLLLDRWLRGPLGVKTY